MKILTKSYIGLGGNIGDSVSVLEEALKELALIPAIEAIKVSSFYQTTPVSDLPQNMYTNAVASLFTSLSPFELLKELQQIEARLGKVMQPKLKNQPRVIDLDILFFGELSMKSEELEIPHPRWQERLFVLTPLSELTHEVVYFKEGKKIKKNIDSLLKEFINTHNETVSNLCKKF